MRRSWSLLAAGLITTTVAASAGAEPLKWNEAYPRFRPVEYVATAVFGTAAIVMYFAVPPQQHVNWMGGILFDDAVRDALRLHAPSAQQTAWTLSDAVDVTLVALVFGLDSLTIPTIRGSTDVALQLGLMDAQAYAYSSTVVIGLYDTVGRARPSYELCQRDPTFVGCAVSPTASFPSGHTNEAFTAAGLSCAHHAFVPIYGNARADALACARDVLLATSEGVLRIMGDRHYATDVLAGATIGFGFGFGIPTLLHYRVPGSPTQVTWHLTPAPGRGPGLAISGTF